MASGIKSFLQGQNQKRENVSTLRPEQEPLYNQAVNAGIGPGAGGAFGQAADYYRGNLSNDPQDMDAFAAPELRRFREQTLPGISEHYAGLGAGGLSSSAFNNSLGQAGADLSERIAALRANLRQSSAQGLQNVGQAGLQNYSQNMVTQEETPGFLETAGGPLITAGLTAAGTALGGPFGGAAGAALGGVANSWLSRRNPGQRPARGNQPYQGGNNIPASPQTQR